jgi:uncharacterized membrane protein
MRTVTSALRTLAIVCHGTLSLSVCGLVLRALPVSPAREIALAAAVLPLIVTAPGLVRGKRLVEQWVAVLLVAYAGASMVEVVANAGAMPFGSVALLASLLELGLVLALIRRPRPALPEAPG